MCANAVAVPSTSTIPSSLNRHAVLLDALSAPSVIKVTTETHKRWVEQLFFYARSLPVRVLETHLTSDQLLSEIPAELRNSVLKSVQAVSAGASPPLVMTVA